MSARSALGRTRRPTGVAVLLAVLASLLVISPGSDSVETPVLSAADLREFSAGNIIADGVFFAGRSMSAGDVEAFIAEKNSPCTTGSDGTPCFRDFRQDTTSRPADAYCSGYAGAPRETAAVIITKVAVSCNISPKVLLVMLQKEQSLVTASGTRLYATRYQKAMGFACPDTAPCDAAYYGFQNQVYSAARQFQRYTANPTGFGYQAGRTVNVRWNPDADCGSAPVTIQNQATANLYIYTPYQPNKAALAAGYGSGDACSAYGNRNFWLYFTDWFGSTQSDAVWAASPKGALDSLRLTASGFSAVGWSFDPDAGSAAVTVRALVDGVAVTSVPTQVARPDVAQAYGVGPNQGYQIAGNLRNGPHQVCIVADNVTGAGAQMQLGCRFVTFTDVPPTVAVDVFAERPDGTVRISGWAYDADGSAAQVHVYTNGRGRAYDTTVARPDVQAAHPEAGPNAGFDVVVGPFSGSQDVCLFAVDAVAPGNNTLLRCQSYRYQPPVGAVDVVAETTTGELRVTGWALDPSLPETAIQAHVYVNGRGYAIDASRPRPDIARAFPEAGAAHGFEAVLPGSPGVNRVCVFGINVGVTGANPLFLCRDVTLKYTAPVGVVDAVRAIGDGRVSVVGWMLDRSVPTAPVTVHHYVDGRFVAASEASRPRPDIAAAFPGAGPGHGFVDTLDVGVGRKQICTFALNLGVAGQNPLMRCVDVTVYDRAPLGAVDSIAASSPGRVRVQGWAFDPDAAPTADAPIRVTVDGVDRGTFPTDVLRTDVARVHGTGDRHGYSIELPVAAGQREVCVSALSTGVGATPKLLRCERVTT